MTSVFSFRTFLAAVVLALLAAMPVMAQVPGTGTNYETRLSGLENEMRGLNGKLEQMEFSIRRIDQGLQRLQGDMDARLTKLESAPPPAATPSAPPPPAASAAPPGEAPQAIGGAAVPPAEAKGSLGALKIQNGKVTGGFNNPKATPLPATPPDYGLTVQEQYDRAFGLLRQANYDDAEKAFKTFIDKNPKDKLVDNAKYWYAETLYVRGKFDASAPAFADAWQQNPQGSKAADSLLKLAMSLGGLDKTKDACVALGELKSKYPNASPTLRARANEERTKLKCAAQ
ncbi:MAG: tol-pal system protein YbgF [Alphaproteobacteria bacterium]|nr:tol-pal system protein YbgF [Alphaproteobacteria bacterium]